MWRMAPAAAKLDELSLGCGGSVGLMWQCGGVIAVLGCGGSVRVLWQCGGVVAVWGCNGRVGVLWH